jgi:hypothetical protein
MKKIKLQGLLGAVLSVGLCGACSRPATAHDLVVYHVGFDVDTITGYHEADFPRAGCRGAIDEKTFKSLLRRPVRPVKYLSDDVKAMVIAGKGEIYYLDYGGVTRLGSHVYTIDKSRFEKAIKYAAKCDN